MTDFAAAAMMRLIRHGLERQGRALPDIPNPPGVHVPLAAKRDVLGWIERNYGLLGLLRIGEAVADVDEEPALIALLRAGDPEDLLGRWSRLERHVHSRHVVTWHGVGDRLCLRHRAAEDPQPLLSENLLIHGVLVGLVEALAGWQVRVADIAGGWAIWKDGQWSVPDPSAPCEDRALTMTVARTDTRDVPVPSTPVGSSVALSVRTALSADPTRCWSLDDVAAAHGRSRRSLQRDLSIVGTSFARLVAETRVTEAARMLCETDRSASEIGFVCGFSDQAHFNRVFKRLTALTPKTYRQAFR